MPHIRTTLIPAVLIFAACSPAVAPPPAAVPAQKRPVAPWALTLEEEATVLRMEDRRAFDPSLAALWIAHENPMQRRRMALALGRIGGATFVDENDNGLLDEGERKAGVDLLSTLSEDPVHEVREAAAFALGEIGDPAGIAALYRFANDREHAGVAAEAVEALSKLAAHVPPGTYAGWTRAEIPEGIRARAIRYLFRFEDPAAALIAAEALSDRSVAIRREAAYSLSRTPAASARDRLHLLLNDPDTLVRAYTARALGRIGDASSAAPLLDSLGDIHPWVRTNAVLALAQIAERDPGVLDAVPAADALGILTLARDADSGTRISTVDALGQLARTSDPARARLLELATDGSSWEREVATAAFIRHFGQSDVDSVRSLLQTDSRFVAIRALEASRTLGRGGAYIREMFFAAGDPAIRAAALSAIPEEELESRREIIIAALDDPDPIVRSTAIGRFAEIASTPPPEKLEVLRAAAARAAADDLNDARVAAVGAIGELRAESRIALLEEWAGDSDPVVRRIAAEALAAAGRPRPQYTPLAVDRPLTDYIAIAEWALSPRTATFHTTRGDIEVALLTQDAPMTAWNFARLAAEDYFDGTTFMRVVPNFVIQGGDPRNDQSGGPGYSIRDEINIQKYTRGALGMALSGPDTGGSQYFITHSPQPHLDGGYTIFGRVIDGMSGVVDQIQRGDVVTDVSIDGREPENLASRITAVEKAPLPLEVGPITPERLLALVPEYPERKESYSPDPVIVEAIAAMIQPQDRLEVYLGTWCSDSQREVPKLLKLLDLLDELGATLPVTYLAVDRAKREPAERLEGKSVQKVSTFIYYRGNDETGRIEETPEGLFEDHFLRIVAGP